MALVLEVRKALPGFTLDVAWEAGDEVVTLFGPSGAGKTLTLQCLAGLARPERGRIVVDGRVFFDSVANVDLRPQERRIGYVFQGYALSPLKCSTTSPTVCPSVRTARRERTGGVERWAGGSGLAGACEIRAASSSVWLWPRLDPDPARVFSTSRSPARLAAAPGAARRPRAVLAEWRTAAVS